MPRHRREISLDKEIIELQSVIDKLLIGKKAIKVLEVGCGSSSHICMEQNAYIVGIDISEKQLQRNNIINEKILGDIQNYDFPESDFDLIICWNVLEHISHPERALRIFLKTIKEGGFIIIRLPNVFSIKGLITKYTPFWFHVWVYRVLYGYKLVGIDDYGPFRTYLRLSIAPTSIKRFATENNLSIEYFNMYESRFQKKLREKYAAINAIWWLLRLTIKVLSFNKIDVNHTEYMIVLKQQKIGVMTSLKAG